MSWPWLVHLMGGDFTLPYGRWGWYNFWSGIGSDLSEITLVAGLVAVYRRHTCEVRWCWRIGRLDTAAGHCVCRRHHPDVPSRAPTGEQVAAAHREAADA